MEIISDGSAHLTKIIDDYGNAIPLVQKLTIIIDAKNNYISAVAEVIDVPVVVECSRDSDTPVRKISDADVKTRLFWIKKLDAFGVELVKEPHKVDTNGN
jgi:hypothetical protein